MAEIRVMYDSDSSGLVVGGCCRFSRVKVDWLPGRHLAPMLG